MKAIDVECPYCHVPAGTWCTTKTGHGTMYAHTAREKTAAIANYIPPEPDELRPAVPDWGPGLTDEQNDAALAEWEAELLAEQKKAEDAKKLGKFRRAMRKLFGPYEPPQM